MKKFLFLILLLFSTIANAQLSYNTNQVNTILINVDQKATLQMTNQTIDGSVTIGDVCELTSTGWNKADASAEATADGVLGIYLGSNIVLIQGIYTTVGLSAGTLYWLSETEGQWNSLKPSPPSIIRFVGQGLSTTAMLFNPNGIQHNLEGDTLGYTAAEMDKILKNTTISRFDISNPALADTFMVFWTDDSLEVDSIQVWADDSTTIQIQMDATNMLISAYLIDDGVSSTITSINEGTLLAGKKARLYFTALGDNVKKVLLKFYWKFL